MLIAYYRGVLRLISKSVLNIKEEIKDLSFYKNSNLLPLFLIKIKETNQLISQKTTLLIYYYTIKMRY